MKVWSTVLLIVLLFYLTTLYVDAQASCPAAPNVPGDRRPDKSKLIVATFNAEWLFLTRSNCPGSGCTWKNIDEAKLHLSNIANVIVDMNADIVVLEETENCNVLMNLLALSQIANKGYKPYLITGTDTATGQNVGIITRVDPVVNLERTSARYDYPIADSQCGYKGSGSSTVSKHFYTTFHVAGLSKPLLLVGLHFVAFPLQADRCSQREAQASVIRDIVVEHGLKKGYHVIVTGDFNDHDPTITDEAKSLPISKVFSIIKGSDLNNAMITHSGHKTGAGVYSGWWDKNSNCRDDKGGEHTLIDHVLVSKSLNIHSAKFHHTYVASCTSYISDHWPIIVEIPTVSSMEVDQEVETPTVQANPTGGQETTYHNSSSQNATWAVLAILGTVFVAAVITIAVVIVWRRKKQLDFQPV